MTSVQLLLYSHANFFLIGAGNCFKAKAGVWFTTPFHLQIRVGGRHTWAYPVENAVLWLKRIPSCSQYSCRNGCHSDCRHQTLCWATWLPIGRLLSWTVTYKIDGKDLFHARWYHYKPFVLLFFPLFHFNLPSFVIRLVLHFFWTNLLIANLNSVIWTRFVPNKGSD